MLTDGQIECPLYRIRRRAGIKPSTNPTAQEPAALREPALSMVSATLI